MRKFEVFIVAINVIVLITNTQGQTWSPVGTGIGGYGRIESMCEYQGDLYVGGFFHNIGGLSVNSLARWNGNNWDSVPGMSIFGSIEIFDMVVYNNELIIVGNQIHKWNGISWSDMGVPPDNRQFAVETYNDELYITGHFQSVGGVPTRGIAKWNGIVWDSVGGPGLNLSPGFDGNDLIEYNGELYLAGGFSLVNGLPVHSIARWDGIAWDSVGVIKNNCSIQCLCEYNNKLYSGGNMRINNNLSTQFICNWDGSVLDSVGYGLNYSPYVMKEYNNELYVAGDFDIAGQTQALGIARWNNTTWLPVGSGLDLFHINQDTMIFIDTTYYTREHIYTMYVYNNELYVGGIFNMAGGILANGIAKWNSTGMSVNELSTNNGINIYPNPATTELHVKVRGVIEDNYTITMYDTQGKTVDIITTNDQETVIDISKYPQGVYWVRALGNNIVRSEKIIKLKTN